MASPTPDPTDWQVSDLLKTEAEELHVMALKLEIRVKVLDRAINVVTRVIDAFGRGPFEGDRKVERDALMAKRRQLRKLRRLYLRLLKQIPPVERETEALAEDLSPFPRLQSPR